MSPSKIISLFSLSKKDRVFSSIKKDLSGSFGGLYQARTRKGLLVGGSTSMQIISTLSMGASDHVLHLIEYWM